MSKKTYRKVEKLNFNSLFETKGYPKNSWPILNEYFSRYKTEFGLTDDELNKKVQVVMENLDEIKIDGTENDSYSGRYEIENKTVVINQKKLESLKMQESAYIDTVFHELNHVAEGHNSVQPTTFMKYHQRSNTYSGVALNEIITEMKSSRLVSDNRTKQVYQNSSKKHVLALDGYGDLIFAGSMMHAALGMDEKEFLKLTDGGKGKFGEEVQTMFPEKEGYDTFISGMTYATDTLHRLKYNRDSSVPYTMEDVENMERCTNSIYDHCLYAMGNIIPQKAMAEDGRINVEEFMSKTRYFLDKINANHDISKQFVDIQREGVERKTIAEKMHDNVINEIRNDGETPENKQENPFLIDVKTKILAIEALGKNRSSFSENEYKEMLSGLISEEWIGKDKLFEIYEKCGIEHGNQEISELYGNIESPNRDRKFLEQDYGVAEWDDRNCMKYIKKIDKKENFISKTFRSIKEKITRNNQIKSLPPTKEETEQIPQENSLIAELSKNVIDNPTYR